MKITERKTPHMNTNENHRKTHENTWKQQKKTHHTCSWMLTSMFWYIYCTFLISWSLAWNRMYNVAIHLKFSLVSSNQGTAPVTWFSCLYCSSRSVCIPFEAKLVKKIPKLTQRSATCVEPPWLISFLVGQGHPKLISRLRYQSQTTSLNFFGPKLIDTVRPGSIFFGKRSTPLELIL